MHCDEARHLLKLGVLPGAADPVRTMLGFHLSSCSTCRGYRTQLHNQQPLQTLLTQVPPLPYLPAETPRPATFSNGATYSLRAASVALLIGGALALNPLGAGATARAAETSSAASTTYVSHRAANTSRMTKHASNNTARARLAVAGQRQAVGAPASEAAPAIAAVAEAVESSPLQEGMELVIPALPHSLEEIAAAPAGQVAPLALYVVRAGDSLSTIAQQFYGDASLWQTIYTANQGVIGGNASLIFTGQLLTIPAKPSTPAQPGGGQPANQPSGIRVVQAGDTLSGIALAQYGDASQWRTIYNANAALIDANYNLIFPGQRLTLPAAQTGQGMPGNAPVSSPSQGGYVVQSGDTLSAIAQKTYGNASLWNVIYQANRSVIGGDPNLIFPGQQFTLPAVS